MSNELLMELAELKGNYQLNIDGNLNILASNFTNYSNVIFENLTFTNNSTINGNISIYNNLLITGGPSQDIFATSMYSVFSSNSGSSSNVNIDYWNKNSNTLFTNSNVTINNLLIQNHDAYINYGSVVNFRGNNSNYETNASTISSGKFTSNSLDIVGGGYNLGYRKVTVLDQLGVGKVSTADYSVDVLGSINFGGSLYQNNQLVNLSPYVLPSDVAFNNVGISNNLAVGNIAAINTLNVSGNINSGSILASGAITGNQLSSSTNILAGGTVSCYKTLQLNNATGYQAINSEKVPAGMQIFFSKNTSDFSTNWSHIFSEDGRAVKGNGTTAWDLYSDVRLKRNIYSITDGLEKILELKPVSFSWKVPAVRDYKTHYGFIAQDIEKTLPHCVSKMVTNEFEKHLVNNEDTCLSIVQDFNPWIVNAIQQLNSRITELENIVSKYKI